MELAGRIAWLLGPVQQGAPTPTPDQRAGRFILEGLADAYRSADEKKSSGRSDKDDLAMANELKREAFAVFPPVRGDIQSQLDWEGFGSLKTWRVAGEKFQGFEDGMKHFAKDFMPGEGGLYSELSNASHPSLAKINLHSASLGEHGRQHYRWVAPLDVIDVQVHLASTTLWGAAAIVTRYCGSG